MHGENQMGLNQQCTVEFNNSDRPGGGDGSLNIKTGIFTTVTSGYYVITFSSNVIVYSGEHTGMYLYHNGVSVTESFYETRLDVGNGHIIDQGSRTVVSFACL